MDRCKVYCNDEIKVNRVKKAIEKMHVETSAHLFKALGDVNRIKMALALSTEEKICVCDPANIIGSSLATVSHHLRLLQNLELVGHRKEGKLPFTIKLSRKAVATIKQNITFSLVIKVIALLLVIHDWLTLWIAIIADRGATLIVTLNSLRLLKIEE